MRLCGVCICVVCVVWCVCVCVRVCVCVCLCSPHTNHSRESDNIWTEHKDFGFHYAEPNRLTETPRSCGPQTNTREQLTQAEAMSAPHVKAPQGRGYMFWVFSASMAAGAAGRGTGVEKHTDETCVLNYRS